MGSCSSSVDVSKMVNTVGLYTHAQVWLVNRWLLIAEVELWLLGVVV